MRVWLPVEPTTSFGAYVASAALAKTSVPIAAHAPTIARCALCMCTPFGSPTGRHELACRDPVDLVVVNDLRLRDRVVVRRRRRDGDARPHERVDLVQVRGGVEQRLSRRVLACVLQ